MVVGCEEALPTWRAHGSIPIAQPTGSRHCTHTLGVVGWWCQDAPAPNPVGKRVIDNDPEAGMRLRLSVGTVSEDIMVFGQRLRQPPPKPIVRIALWRLRMPEINGAGAKWMS